MSDNNTTIILLTFNYPFGKGEQFIATELAFLLLKFRRVIILPFNAFGPARSVPEGVFVNLSLARRQNKLLDFLEIALRGLVSPLLYQEITHDPRSALVFPRLLRMVQYLGNAIRVKTQIHPFIKKLGLDLESTIFYTYWISFLSYGIGLAKSGYPNLTLVSRAHSGDVYEIQQQPPFFPFRRNTLLAIDRIYCVSDHARNYLTERYPFIKTRLEVSKLGVMDPGFETLPSTDTNFRIITNSFFTRLKRIDLLIQSIGKYARSNRSHQVEWHHIGDGPLRDSLEIVARTNLPANVQWKFLGFIPHPAVYLFYQTHPIDVMVNVSRSEAISVSMMEAQSCGIPVIATRVGGTPEIISDHNGILLDSNPSPEAIAEALRNFFHDKEKALAMRKESKKTWRTMYNAEINYTDFANRLFKLITDN